MDCRTGGRLALASSRYIVVVDGVGADCSPGGGHGCGGAGVRASGNCCFIIVGWFGRRNAISLWGMVSIGFWEAVKLVSSVGLLVFAPRWLSQVHWLSMVLMFVLVVKAYWLVVLLVRWRKRRAGAAVLKQVLENGV